MSHAEVAAPAGLEKVAVEPVRVMKDRLRVLSRSYIPIQRARIAGHGGSAMKTAIPKPLRCAIYTRKSTEHNLDLAFNSLDAQREACEAYIKSQAHEGWRLLPVRYDDGGLSGARRPMRALEKASLGSRAIRR